MTTPPADTIAAELAVKLYTQFWKRNGWDDPLPLEKQAPVIASMWLNIARDALAGSSSRYDEACGIIRGLLGELKRFHNGKPVSLCATCNTVAAAQAFLSGTPTDGTQGGEWQCTWPECDGVIQGGPCVCDPSRKLAKDGQV